MLTAHPRFPSMKIILESPKACWGRGGGERIQMETSVPTGGWRLQDNGRSPVPSQCGAWGTTRRQGLVSVCLLGSLSLVRD